MGEPPQKPKRQGHGSILPSRLRRAIYLLLPFTLLALLIPNFVNTYDVGSIMFLFMVYAVLALSYDIMGGFAGYMNLGHVVFFGIGAYVAAILFRQLGMSLALGIAAAPVVVTVFAYLFSFPLFRLKGFYFSVAGLAFVELAELVVASMNAQPLTNGFDGIHFVQYNVFIPYYAAVALTVFSVLVSVFISGSRFGLALRSIRADEEVADSVGIDVPRTKRTALVISAVLAGVDGAVYFWGRGAISPDAAFGFTIAFVPVTLALLGGSGTIVGPLIGGAIFIYLQNYGIAALENLAPGTAYFPNAVTGLLLIFVGLFMPRGIVGSPRVRRAIQWVYFEMTR
jgi:ABC-type branched-subunit amino acid transport system permease subunit